MLVSKCFCRECSYGRNSKADEGLRDGPLENVWGGGGAGEIQKKYSRKEKLNEKYSYTPINPKKYSCSGLKKFHTRNLITQNNSCC